MLTPSPGRYGTNTGDDVNRHDLVWLGTAVRPADLRVAEPADHGIVMRWLAEGRPLIVTRRPGDTPGHRCSLGLSLPRHLGRRRIAVDAPENAIRNVRPPPSLQQVTATAPAGVRRSLRALGRHASRYGIRFRVFGSMAWQFLTGEEYAGPDSDLDLLWRPGSVEEMRRGLTVLSRWEAGATLRADGEVVLPDGRGVAWRELAMRPPVVLAKGLHGVELVPYGDVEFMFLSGSACQAPSLQSG